MNRAQHSSTLPSSVRDVLSRIHSTSFSVTNSYQRKNCFQPRLAVLEENQHANAFPEPTYNKA